MATSEMDLLKGLSPEEAAAVVALGRRDVIAAGATLFRLGDSAEALFLVERGLVRLTLPVRVGGRSEELAVEERQPGQLVGWSGLVPPHRFTLNASAPVETELLVLSRQALSEHFAAHAAVGYTVSRNLASIVGQRLQVLQAMWLREMQRGLDRQQA